MGGLEKLFGSTERLRLLRFFILNEPVPIAKRELCEKLMLSPAGATRALGALEGAGLIKKRGGVSTIKRGKRRETIRREIVYTLNPTYPYLEPFRAFITATLTTTRDAAGLAIKRGGNVKLLIASGIFTDNHDGRLDFLIVGDRLHDATLKRALRKVEADLGREIRYATLPTEEYVYRSGIHDKLLRDVLDYPHDILIDRRKR